MEVEDDDVFYADLNKQVSLLIMEDNEDQFTHCPSVPLQGFSGINHPAAFPQSSSSLYNQQNSRRQSKGTGVFIPQSSSNMRRKSKQGRFSSSSSNTKKFEKHSDNPRGPPHASSMNNPSHHSFNPSKRC